MKLSRELTQKNELNENDINYFKNEINIQNKRYEDESNQLKSNDEENQKIEKELSEEKDKNENLTEKFNTIENKFIESQNQLLEAKQLLTSLKNDIKPKKEKYDENQNEIININDQIIIEISQSNDINQKNHEINALIKNTKNRKIIKNF